MNCFILAAGESVRFDATYPKQHIAIDGERLIDRIYRQFVWFGPKTVARNALILKGSFIYPTDNSSTAATVLSTKAFWSGDRSLFLYSDVFYTDEAVRSILLLAFEMEPPTFFTDGVDIFGFTGPRCDEQFECALADVAAEADAPHGNMGRIWEVYRRLHGIEEWPIPPEHNKPGLVFIGDRTQDFDTVADLEEFRAGGTKNALLRREMEANGIISLH